MKFETAMAIGAAPALLGIIGGFLWLIVDAFEESLLIGVGTLTGILIGLWVAGWWYYAMKMGDLI